VTAAAVTGNAYVDEAGNRYEATHDTTSGGWHTGYQDPGGVWHEVPPSEMPLEAFTDDQLADLEFSDSAGLSPQQREAVQDELHNRAISEAPDPAQPDVDPDFDPAVLDGLDRPIADLGAGGAGEAYDAQIDFGGGSAGLAYPAAQAYHGPVDFGGSGGTSASAVEAYDSQPDTGVVAGAWDDVAEAYDDQPDFGGATGPESDLDGSTDYGGVAGPGDGDVVVN